MQNINTGREGLAEDARNTEQTCPLRSSAWHFQNLSVSEFYSTSEARGRGLEEQPHIQGAVAAWAPEGLEELFHIQGWEGRL